MKPEHLKILEQFASNGADCSHTYCHNCPLEYALTGKDCFSRTNEEKRLQPINYNRLALVNEILDDYKLNKILEEVLGNEQTEVK